MSGTNETTRSINIKDRVVSAMRQTRTRLTQFGRYGFRGKHAEQALQELKEVAKEEEEDEQRLLGSKRVFKFVRAATRTIQRPLKRKNHPGEVYDSRSGHR